MTSADAKRRRGLFARWAVAALAMAFVVRELFSDPEPLRRVLGTPWQVLLAVGALLAVNQLLMSFRFSLAVALYSGKRVPASVWFRLISVGQMLNLFVPQLGSVYRGVALKREFGIAYMTYASGLFAFVWLDLVMGFLIGSLTIAVLDPTLYLGSVLALPALALLILALLTGPFAIRWFVSVFRVKGSFATKVQARMTTLLSNAASALKAPAFMLRFFLLNVLVTVVQVVLLALLFRAVDAEVPLAALLLFQVLLKLANQIVITPGNLGITELMFGVLAHGSRCTLEQGLAVALLFRTTVTVMVILLGVLAGGARVLFSGRARLEEEDARPEPP
jgi:uncharacterized membrane protein YbhN (UPF0104 family)